LLRTFLKQRELDGMVATRILVVEDENITALSIKKMLQDLGYVVTALVSSGEAALRYTAETQPDLVLMDIKLQGNMDGVAAAERIRAQFNIPVIYLTAFADEVTLQRAKVTKPYGYLLKPFEERELHNAIEVGLYQHQTERKLQESERWLAATLNSIREGVVTTDAQGRIMSMNPAAERLTGWQQAEALNQDCVEILNILAHEKNTPGESLLRKILPAGGELTNCLLLARDGLETFIDGNVAPLRDDQGNILGAVLTFRDISERRRAEEEIGRHNRELTLLNQVIAASVTSLEPENFLETTCRALAPAFDLPLVTAALLSQDKTTAVVVAEYTLKKQTAFLNRSFSVDRDALLQPLLVNKTPMRVTDIRDDPRCVPIFELLHQHNVVSLLMLPLVLDGEVMGLLTLGSLELHRFTDSVTNLAWTVANQVAGALSRVQLNQQRRQLSAVIEQTAESVIITDVNGAITYVNPAFEQVSGYSQTEVIGRNPHILKSGKQDTAFYRQLWKTIRSGQVWHGRLTNKKKNGSLFVEEATITPVRNEIGTIVNYVAIKRDVTRELELQEQFYQMQKMEAVGLLAGGIAHDFNNILLVINGFAEMIKNQLPPDDPVQQMAGKILDGGKRAASLTRQLLAFSRKQVAESRVFDLNSVVQGMEKMLSRLIGEHIQVQTHLAPQLWSVKADPNQIEQVIVNLVVNARDAMPAGGRLIIETANVILEEENIFSHSEIQPGEYVMLTVSDTGVGLSQEVKIRIFEPFFTTKEVGKGTGLGLATAYGIVKQGGGYIWVYSEEGQGTTFKIYLPRVIEKGVTHLNDKQTGKLPQGTEVIILAEDEPAVRELATRILREQGYTVLEAANGYEALHIWQERSKEVQLLVTDMSMPEMSGKELAEKLRQTQPGLKIIFLSGHSDEMIAHLDAMGPDITFLQKPFNAVTLLDNVRKALDMIEPPSWAGYYQIDA
jgi:PAS domain S-box-containing protein